MAQQQIIPMWHLGGEQKKCKQERQVHWNKDLFPFLFLVIVQISLNIYFDIWLQNRKNDETSYEKMLKLRRDLNRAV